MADSPLPGGYGPSPLRRLRAWWELGRAQEKALAHLFLDAGGDPKVAEAVVGKRAVAEALKERETGGSAPPPNPPIEPHPGLTKEVPSDRLA